MGIEISTLRKNETPLDEIYSELLSTKSLVKNPKSINFHIYFLNSQIYRFSASPIKIIKGKNDIGIVQFHGTDTINKKSLFIKILLEKIKKINYENIYLQNNDEYIYSFYDIQNSEFEYIYLGKILSIDNNNYEFEVSITGLSTKYSLIKNLYILKKNV